MQGEATHLISCLQPIIIPSLGDIDLPHINVLQIDILPIDVLPIDVPHIVSRFPHIGMIAKAARSGLII
jgi:hypothetical protein